MNVPRNIIIAAALLSAAPALAQSGYPSGGAGLDRWSEQGRQTTGAVGYATGASDSPLVLGEPATSEELAEARGGNAVAIVIAGVVVAVRSCSTNAICRTVATAIIKALGKKAGDIIIETSTPALHRKLCKSGFRRYC